MALEYVDTGLISIEDAAFPGDGAYPFEDAVERIRAAAADGPILVHDVIMSGGRVPGIRWTTLVKFPVALSGGRRENWDPVAPPRLSTSPCATHPE